MICSVFQWLHGMEAEPPGVLAMCPIPSASEESSGASSDKGRLRLLDSTSILLIFPRRFCFL